MNWFWFGSVASGFISFSAVIMLNSRPAIVLYVESPSRPAAMAVPKYRPDCAAAAPSVVAAAFADGIMTATAATVTTLTAPASTARTAGDRRRRYPPREMNGLIATLASLLANTRAVWAGTTGRLGCHIERCRCFHPSIRSNNMFRKSFGTVLPPVDADDGATWPVTPVR